MRAVAYAVLLAGLAASTALAPPPASHADGRTGAVLDAALPGQFAMAHAQQTPDQLPFVTTWKTDSANQTISIP